MLEVRNTRTSAANPRSNGVVERLNRTLISMIKAFLKGEQTNWDKHLSCLASAYRSTPNESTHMTPNLIMFGREVRLPIEVLYLSDANADGEVATYGEYVHKLRERLQRAHAITRRHLGNSANRQKQAYDAKHSFHQYNPGDLVWYFSDLKQLKTAPKLRRPFEGPYLVMDKINDLDYAIQLDSHKKRKVVHHNKLKPYEGGKTLSWAKAALREFRKQ